MQRENDKNKEGHDSNINRNLPSSPTNSDVNTNTNINTRDLNATSSYQPQQVSATAMRSTLQNPSGFNYAVAEPSIGGTAVPYDSANIETAKQHLADSLNSTRISNTDSANISSDNTGVSGAAAKNMATHDDENHPQPAHMPSYAKDIPSSTASVATLYGSASPAEETVATNTWQANKNKTKTVGIGATSAAVQNSQSKPATAERSTDSTAYALTQPAGTTDTLPARNATSSVNAPISSGGPLEPRHSTGLNTSSAPYSSSLSTDQQRGLLQGEDHLPESMKGREVSTAAVMGATSPWAPAPPIKDTVTSTTDVPPTVPGQAPSSTNMGMDTHKPTAADVGLLAGAAGTAGYITSLAHQPGQDSTDVSTDENLKATRSAERRPSLAEKVKNVFRRRSSTAEPEKDNLESRDIRDDNIGNPNSDSIIKQRKSSGLSAREMATAAAAAAKIQAATAAGPHSQEVNRTLSNASQEGRTMAAESPHLTSSGAPRADLHATSGNLAPKVDAVPTTTLNQGYNHIKRTDADVSKTTATDARAGEKDRRPLKERISAPIFGSVIAGTGVLTGRKASRDASKDTTQTNPTVTPSATTTSTTPSGASMDSTAAVYAPSTDSPARMSSASPGAGAALDQGGMNDRNAQSGATSPPASPSRPLAEKIKAPMVGAAAAVAGIGHRMKETVSNVARRRSSVGANKASGATTTGTTGTVGPMTATTSSNVMPVVGAGSATGASMTAKDLPAKDTLQTTSATPLTHETTTPTTTGGSNVGTAAALEAAAAAHAAYAGHMATPATMTSSYDANTPQSNLAGMSTKPGVSVISSADQISATPASTYHGDVPKAGPGEEVVWVKTVTTTDYYDPGNARESVGDVVEKSAEQRGGGRHM
ncbi:hypothetical protein BGX28_006292 [Mortierella sp. GBA30]|nr:hypothetical protein BGX28_006292 [Mortierella sp. GBA30]